MTRRFDVWGTSCHHGSSMLPEVIEIDPLPGPLRAEINVPGSKSITNRALILAALGRGVTVLRGALWSEDTEAMVDCLQRLGFELRVSPDPREPGNRSIEVAGCGGIIPRGGTPTQPMELHVANAGTAARFVTAFVCLGQGTYRISGIPRMHERPQAALIQALRELGYRIDAPGDRLPAVVHGTGRRPGHCRISVAESSQFASALMLSAGAGGWRISIDGANPDELPYVEMTRKLIEVFPLNGGEFQIEPDASGGSYFQAAGMIAPAGSDIRVGAWPQSGWQIDAEFPKFWPLPPTISRESDLGDSIMTAITLAPFAEHAVTFTELGRLRVQECERVQALRTELSRCGARITEVGDTLVVRPSPLHGATVETYNDHRMAMCLATLGLKVAGMRITNAECVRKTFPTFFQKLAAPAPNGLGVVIRNAATGRILPVAELRAD